MDISPIQKAILEKERLEALGFCYDCGVVKTNKKIYDPILRRSIRCCKDCLYNNYTGEDDGT